MDKNIELFNKGLKHYENGRKKNDIGEYISALFCFSNLVPENLPPDELQIYNSLYEKINRTVNKHLYDA
jgi:hypothetical protein